MYFKKVGKHTLALALFSIVVFLISLTFAQAEENKKSLVYSAGSENLEWGPCPDIFPVSCEIAVLQGSPEEKNTDIFFKIPPGTELLKHKHTSAERMVLVSGKLQVNYEGQNKEVLKKGYYAYGPPELPHTATCLEGEYPCVLFIAFNQPIDVYAVETNSDK